MTPPRREPRVAAVRYGGGMADKRYGGGMADKCSFCGRRRDQVKALVAGPGVFICDACVALCTEIIGQEPPPPAPAGPGPGHWVTRMLRRGRPSRGWSRSSPTS